MTQERLQLLVLVKAYPNPSRKYGETCCVAGVRLVDGKLAGWIRLYPVPFRQLEENDRFRKYEVIELEVAKALSDRRPETRKPNLDSLKATGQFLDTSQAWRRRRPFVEPLMAPSMCELQRRQGSDRTSLGIFRPREIRGLDITAVDVAQEKQALAASAVAQGSILTPAESAYQQRAIELLPFAFKYRYFCADPACKEHVQTIVDWEIAELYRREKRHSDWRERIRKKWLDELCGPTKDTAFIVGNQFMHPKNFLVLGVWWPPRRAEQLQLG